MKRQGQFPVIFISLKDANGSSYPLIFKRIRSAVAGLFDQHRELLQSDRKRVEPGFDAGPQIERLRHAFDVRAGRSVS